MPDLVSIIIPTFNRPNELERAVISALSVDYPTLEVIVVNDGGNIAQAEQVLKTHDHKVKLIHHERNLGVSVARNSGISVAKGKYVLFLDDDDELYSDFLKEAVAEMKGDVKVVFGRVQLASDTEDMHFKRVCKYNDLLVQKYHRKPVSSWGYFLQYMPAIHSMLFHTEVLQSTLFDARITYGEDRILMLKLKQQGIVMTAIDTFAGRYYLDKKEQSIPDISQFIFHANPITKDRKSRAYLYFLEGYHWFRQRHFLRWLICIIRSLKSPEVVMKQFVLYLRLYFLQ